MRIPEAARSLHGRRRLSVVEELAERGPASADQLARRIGVDSATVHNALQALRQVGLVKLAGTGPPPARGGHRTVLYALDPVAIRDLGRALLALARWVGRGMPGAGPGADAG